MTLPVAMPPQAAGPKPPHPPPPRWADAPGSSSGVLECACPERAWGCEAARPAAHWTPPKFCASRVVRAGASGAPTAARRTAWRRRAASHCFRPAPTPLPPPPPPHSPALPIPQPTPAFMAWPGPAPAAPALRAVVTTGDAPGPYAESTKPRSRATPPTGPENEPDPTPTGRRPKRQAAVRAAAFVADLADDWASDGERKPSRSGARPPKGSRLAGSGGARAAAASASPASATWEAAQPAAPVAPAPSSDRRSSAKRARPSTDGGADPFPSFAASGPEDAAERRRQRRLAKNRATAALSRERRRAQVHALEARVRVLTQANAGLQAALGARVAALSACRAELAAAGVDMPDECDDADVSALLAPTAAAPASPAYSSDATLSSGDDSEGEEGLVAGGGGVGDDGEGALMLL